MKKTLQEEKQRILQMMRIINEQPFNDAGEPMMTHQQYRDYNEPSEPDYESDEYRNAPDREPGKEDIIKEIEKYFHTILNTYDGEEYYFLTKGVENINHDLMIWFNGNQVGASGLNGEMFEDQNIEDVNIGELLDFLEPFRQYILSGDEAKSKMTKIQKQDSADRNYERNERGAMGGY